MPKIDTTSPVAFNPAAEIVDVPAPAKRVNETAWAAFKMYAPVSITCQHYPQMGGADFSCHSKLRPDAKQLADHVRASHGGSFQIKLRQADKPQAFWDEMANEDLEKLDFRCEICDAQVPLQVQHINKHMKSHSGKIKRIREGALFNLTLSVGAPVTTEEDAFEQFG